MNTLNTARIPPRIHPFREKGLALGRLSSKPARRCCSRHTLLNPSRRDPRGPGFTLIELLVVVTVLVVLLALLTPALDRAIYQAELAVCAAGRLRVTGLGLMQYAADNRRYYPVLPGPRSSESAEWQVTMLYMVGNDNIAALKEFMPVNQFLNDPLSTDLDLEGHDVNTFVYSDYTLWVSWVYRGRGQKPLYKAGQRFTFIDPFTGVEHAFDILASDVDRVAPGNVTLSGHPDERGVLREAVVEDRAQEGYGVEGQGVNQTLSYWSVERQGIVDRGVLDTNTAFQDGSVQRYTGVTWDAWDGGAMVRVPENQGANAQTAANLSQWWNHLPRP